MSNVRINVGCGQSPTRGWRNFDSSPSLYLSKIPLLPSILQKTGLISQGQASYIQFCRRNSIEHGNATTGLPLESGSVQVLYSSHMFEHLDREQVDLFLREARRLLCSGGIIRLVVPDIRMRAEKYLMTQDADAFILSTNLTKPRPRMLARRIIGVLVGGTEQHQWMYDGASLSRLLVSKGFVSVRVLNAGETQIPDPGDLNLREREDESVYVEAVMP